MDSLSLHDLEEGRNDWANIPAVTRDTFRVFNTLLQRQAAAITLLEETVHELTRPKPEDDSRLVRVEQDVLEVQKLYTRTRHAVETVQQRLAAKADAKDVNDHLGEVRRAMDARLKQKADSVALNAAIASRVPMKVFEEQIEAKISVEQLEIFAESKFRDKADLADLRLLQVDVRHLKESKASHDDVAEAIALGVADRVHVADLEKHSQETAAALDRKADANDVRYELEKKADAEAVRVLEETKASADHVMNLLDQKANLHYVNQELLTKADEATVSATLARKVDREENTIALDAKADVEEINDLLTKHVAEVNQVVNNHRRENELLLNRKADVGEVNELFAKMSHDFNNMILALDRKAERAEIVELVEQKEFALLEGIRERSQDVTRHDEELSKLRSEAMRLSSEMVKKTDGAALSKGLKSVREDIQRAIDECRAMVDGKISEEAVTRALGRKVDMADLERLLGQKANIHDTNLELDGKVGIADLQDLLSDKVGNEHLMEIRNELADLRMVLEMKAGLTNITALLDDKATRAEVAELQRSIMRFEGTISKSLYHGGGHRAEQILQEQMGSVGGQLAEVEAHLLDLRAALDRKVDHTELHRELASKISADLVTAALEETVDQFHRVLDMKADFTEVTALRADNAELGSQLIAVADDVRSMISSSDREIREQITHLNHKLGEKADDAAVQSEFRSFADRATVASILDTLAGLKTDVGAKADRGEMMGLLDRKIDLEVVEHELSKIPSRGEVLDAVKRKVDYDDFSAAVDDLRKAKVSRQEFLMAVSQQADAIDAVGAKTAVDKGLADIKRQIELYDRDTQKLVSNVAREKAALGGKVRKVRLRPDVTPLGDHNANTAGDGEANALSRLSRQSRVRDSDSGLVRASLGLSRNSVRRNYGDGALAPSQDTNDVPLMGRTSRLLRDQLAGRDNRSARLSEQTYSYQLGGGGAGYATFSDAGLDDSNLVVSEDIETGGPL